MTKVYELYVNELESGITTKSFEDWMNEIL